MVVFSTVVQVDVTLGGVYMFFQKFVCFMCVRVCVCVCVCVYACMCTCMLMQVYYICKCVRVRVCLPVRVSINAPAM